MIRLSRTFGVAAVLGLTLAVPAGAAPSHAQLRGFQCQQALEPAARAVSVTSVMRPVAHTQAMAVRFQLLSRARGTLSWTSVTGRDLGRWISPADPTLGRRPGDVWILNKPVVDLAAPASYRFRVSFRWTGAHHRVLASAARSSGLCRQPELRPDLAIRRLAAPTPTPAGTNDLYAVTIANDGSTATGSFAVRLAAGARTVQKQVSGLAAHTATIVTLRGPLCSSAAPPTVTIDPQDIVEDFDRANNVATVSCTRATQPFPGA